MFRLLKISKEVFKRAAPQITILETEIKLMILREGDILNKAFDFQTGILIFQGNRYHPWSDDPIRVWLDSQTTLSDTENYHNYHVFPHILDYHFVKQSQKNCF